MPIESPNLHFWETIDQDTDRMEVPGGWIYYRRTMNVTGVSVSCSMVFVPNPENVIYVSKVEQ